VKLYFVELRVSDWRRSVQWYRDVLGLKLLMRDESDSFALFDADGGKVALKAGESRPGVLLAFEVVDLDGWVRRLGGLIGPIKSSDEGYRRARLLDPDGYEISLFEWAREGQP
jgi:catechol 2,3-dioxygenase-like lactoylglutathione lyase family enzyme